MVLARTTHDPGLRKSLRAPARRQALAWLKVEQAGGSLDGPAWNQLMPICDRWPRRHSREVFFNDHGSCQSLLSMKTNFCFHWTRSRVVPGIAEAISEPFHL